MGHTAGYCDGVDRGDNKAFTIGATFGGFFRLVHPSLFGFGMKL